MPTIDKDKCWDDLKTWIDEQIKAMGDPHEISSQAKLIQILLVDKKMRTLEKLNTKG